MEPTGAANRFLAPEDEFVFWEVGSLLVPPRKDSQPASQRVPGCVLWTPPQCWVSIWSLQPSLSIWSLHALGAVSVAWSPCLPPGLLTIQPSCKLSSSPAHLLNPRWSFRAPMTLLWQCGLQAPSFFFSPTPRPPALPKWLSPPRRLHLPPNLPLVSGKIAGLELLL